MNSKLDSMLSQLGEDPSPAFQSCLRSAGIRHAKIKRRWLVFALATILAGGAVGQRLIAQKFTESTPMQIGEFRVHENAPFTVEIDRELLGSSDDDVLSRIEGGFAGLKVTEAKWNTDRSSVIVTGTINSGSRGTSSLRAPLILSSDDGKPPRQLAWISVATVAPFEAFESVNGFAPGEWKSVGLKWNKEYGAEDLKIVGISPEVRAKFVTKPGGEKDVQVMLSQKTNPTSGFLVLESTSHDFRKVVVLFSRRNTYSYYSTSRVGVQAKASILIPSFFDSRDPKMRVSAYGGSVVIDSRQPGQIDVTLTLTNPKGTGPWPMTLDVYNENQWVTSTVIIIER